MVNLDLTGAAPAAGVAAAAGVHARPKEHACKFIHAPTVQLPRQLAAALLCCEALHPNPRTRPAGGGAFSEQTAWPEFHNGVAAGLRLAPGTHQLTRTWVVYNKPAEPSFTHAGMLMALGLTGHLGCTPPAAHWPACPLPASIKPAGRIHACIEMHACVHVADACIVICHPNCAPCWAPGAL